MIDPKELMIGCKIMYREVEVVITELRTKYAEIAYPYPSTMLDDAFYKHLSPIPLTPEILERYGFEQTLNSPELYDAPDGFLDVINDYGSAWYNINDKVLKVGYYHNEIPCEHLHHLQNIIQTLTGKPLIK